MKSPLDARNTLAFLKIKGILSCQDLENSSWTLATPDKHHPICIVTNEKNEGYVVKQPHANDLHHTQLLDREAGLYSLAFANDTFSPLRQILPHHILYDRNVPVLVMEYLHHDNGLELLRREKSDPNRLGETLASAFHCAHIKLPENLGNSIIIKRTIPWILQVIQVPESSLQSEAYYDVLLKIKANPVFSKHLSLALKDWRYTTLTHIDSKMDNVLVDIYQQNKVWIIDWALSGLGDPAWDIGNAIHSALMLWFFSISFSKGVEAQDSAQNALYPLDKIQRFTKSFFQTYAKLSSIDAPQLEDLKFRVVKYLALALIQHVLTDIKFGDTLYQRHIAILDTAHNILLDPTPTISEFL